MRVKERETEREGGEVGRQNVINYSPQLKPQCVNRVHINTIIIINEVGVEYQNEITKRCIWSGHATRSRFGVIRYGK